MGVLQPYIRSFERHLRGENKAENTLKVYLNRAHRFDEWLDGLPGSYLSAFPKTAPEDAADLTPPTTIQDLERGAYVSGYVATVIARTSDATGSNHYRALQAFYKWLSEDEEEIERNPFDRLDPPTVIPPPVPVVRDDSLKRLLATCKGKDFTSLRDTAIILVFVDTGMRLAECARLNHIETETEKERSDVDFTQDVLHTIVKGGRQRAVPFGNKVGLALERYLRKRTEYLRKAGRSVDGPLWIGTLRKDGLTGSGIAQMLERRCIDAGIGHLHPHQFRHTFAHQWRVDGGDETDLMRLMGWRSRQMLARYGESAADERAVAAHRKNSPADRL